MDEIISKAKELYQLKKYSDALIIYKEKLEADPINTLALTGAVDCLKSLGNLDDAIALCGSAISNAPDLVIVHVLLAHLYYDKKDTDKSIYEAKTAVGIDPHSSDALYCYGALLFHEGLYQDALDFLKRASEIEPELYEVHNYLSAIYQRLGDRNGFYNEMKNLTRLKPTFENVFGLIGSYFDRNRLFTVVLVLLPLLIIVNKEMKFLLLIYLPFVLLYTAAGVISLKNQQWQKAISKFLSAALFILMSLFGLLNY